MRQTLHMHADSRSQAVRAIDVAITRASDGLRLSYSLRGDLDAMAWPAPAASARTDELWRHTCFEAFVRGGGGEAYYELNFAPSSQWAAYRFIAYRTRAESAYEGSAPRITTHKDAGVFVMNVAVDLPSAIANLDWRVAVAAVVEETAGGLSYWALKHPPGKADFHHADGFALTLAGKA